MLGFSWYGKYSIIHFNLKSQPAHSELVRPISPAASDSNGRAVQLQS
jgi:hypothetical protein